MSVHGVSHGSHGQTIAGAMMESDPVLWRMPGMSMFADYSALEGGDVFTPRRQKPTGIMGRINYYMNQVEEFVKSHWPWLVAGGVALLAFKENNPFKRP